MAAQPARALATGRRWATVAAASTRAPGAGALGTAPKPINLPTQRDSFAWGNKPVPPASNDEGSGSLTSINVRPASGGSSGSSTSGSDLLDSPLAWGRNSDPVSTTNVLTLHNSGTAISHSQRTDSRSGSVQLSHFQTSFSEALEAPLRSTTKRGPTSHGKGFTPSADDFPVLVSKISESKNQLGDPVPNKTLPIEAQKAQSHVTQAPNICMPPPWLDHWNPPPDHPHDRNRMWHRGAASYGPCKPENTPGTCSLPAEFLIHNCQTLLYQEGEAQHGSVHGGHRPENQDSCYAHVPTDAYVKSLPYLMPRKVKDSKSDTLEKQPVFKKDLVLLEKIRLLNIKARNLRSRNVSEISSHRKSKAEYPKSFDVKTDQVAKDIPFHDVTNDIAASFDLSNRVSERPNLLLKGPSNVPPDLSEGHVTESSEHVKLGNSADYRVQKAKSMAKSEEVNNHSCGQSHKSYNAQIEANKILYTQKTGGNGSAEHDNSPSDSCFIDYAENLNVHLTANGVKNATVSISFTAPSDTVGVTRGPLIHNVAPSVNKTDLNMVERIPQKSAAQSNGTIARKLLPKDSRQRQAESQDRILRERPNIAENIEHNTNVAGNLLETRSSEDKSHMDLLNRNENRRPVSPRVFYPKNTEASTVHKNHTSGVVINSSIIPKQAASLRGFTVGSIMVGDVSLPSVNQEEETVAKILHGASNACENPQQTEQSDYGLQLAKVAHRNNETSRHTGRSFTSGNKVSTNGLSAVGPNITGANSLLSNVTQELSDMSQQVERETHFATQYCAQPTRAVLLPNNNKKMHFAGGDRRQYRPNPSLIFRRCTR